MMKFFGYKKKYVATLAPEFFFLFTIEGHLHTRNDI